MKNRWIVTVAMIAGLCVTAQAVPVEWGTNGHYYEVISTWHLWDDAKTAAEELTYNGYVGHLVTLNSEEEYNFVKNLPELGQWNITWIGGYKEGSDFVWVNGEGTMDFSGWSSSPWASGTHTNKGVSISGSGYGNKLWTQPEGCGEFIVEYQAIPEPASILMIGFGGLLITGYRRICKSYGHF